MVFNVVIFKPGPHFVPDRVLFALRLRCFNPLLFDLTGACAKHRSLLAIKTNSEPLVSQKMRKVTGLPTRVKSAPLTFRSGAPPTTRHRTPHKVFSGSLGRNDR